jgi:hypothetical protein
MTLRNRIRTYIRDLAPSIAMNREPHINVNPYYYGPGAMASGNLFVPELTGCSTTADIRHRADGHEYAEASKIFACHEYLSRVR